ncbi:hypothetical protein [Labilibaculum euxinus]
MKFVITRSNLVVKFVFVLYLLFVIKDLTPFGDKIGFFLNAFVLLLFCFVLFSPNTKIFYFSKKVKIIILICLSLFLLYFLAQYHQTPFNNYFLFYRRLLTPFLFYPILSYVDHISVKRFRNYFFFLIGLQIFIATIQYFNLLPFINLASSVPGLDRRFSGTFPNNNYLGNLLALVGVVILFEILTKRYFGNKKWKFKLLIGELVVCIAILLTGVRTSFVSLGFGILLTFFLFTNRQNFFKIVTVTTITFIILSFTLVTIQNPAIERVREGITGVIDDRGNIEDSKSTIALTFRLLNLVQNDIYLGQGQLFKSGYAVVSSGDSFIPISQENNNITDATLAIIFIEFGLLGLALFILPAFLIWYYSSSMKKEYLILILVLFVQTFMDLGLFNLSQVVFVFLYIKTQNNNILI